MSVQDSLMMRTIRGEAVERAPIWIMRQAGRYMPEYQAIRKEISFLDLCKDVDKSTEVTMLPMTMLDVDAAIVFSDILIPVEAMGLNVAFGNGGPTISDPIRNAEDLKRIHIPDPATEFPWALETIQRVQSQIDGRPCLGFAGAPFTMASYMIEGQTSKSFNKIKAMMFRTPEVLHALLEMITETVGTYLEAQLDAGAPAVQLFDTWAGSLSRHDYEVFALPYQQKIFNRLRGKGATVIYVNGSAGRIDLLDRAGADVVSLDWRTPYSEARSLLGPDRIIQGNLEPCSLYAPPEKIEEMAIALLKEAGPGKHIFNLGHGILPDVPVAHAQALVKCVTSYRY